MTGQTVPVEADQTPVPGSIEERALRWIVGEDTGISSRAIWAVMMGVHEHCRDRSTPADAWDFGRCFRLLKLIPEWEDSLHKMKAIDFDKTINGVRYPKVWSSFVDNYYKMKRMYIREIALGYPRELGEYMHSLGL